MKVKFFFQTFPFIYNYHYFRKPDGTQCTVKETREQTMNRDRHRDVNREIDEITDRDPIRDLIGLCIEDSCRVVGCDKILDSNLELDRCGVCGGNESRCVQARPKTLFSFTLS